MATENRVIRYLDLRNKDILINSLNWGDHVSNHGVINNRIWVTTKFYDRGGRGDHTFNISVELHTEMDIRKLKETFLYSHHNSNLTTYVKENGYIHRHVENNDRSQKSIPLTVFYAISKDEYGLIKDLRNALNGMRTLPNLYTDDVFNIYNIKNDDKIIRTIRTNAPIHVLKDIEIKVANMSEKELLNRSVGDTADIVKLDNFLHILRIFYIAYEED